MNRIKVHHFLCKCKLFIEVLVQLKEYCKFCLLSFDTGFISGFWVQVAFFQPQANRVVASLLSSCGQDGKIRQSSIIFLYFFSLSSNYRHFLPHSGLPPTREGPGYATENESCVWKWLYNFFFSALSSLPGLSPPPWYSN